MRLSPDGARLLARLLDDALTDFAGWTLRLKERLVQETGISRVEALLADESTDSAPAADDGPVGCPAEYERADRKSVA